MKKNSHNPTMMIKSKFSNDVHKVLEPNMEIKRRDRWRHRDNYKFTDEQKIAMFDEIIKLHNNCSNELTNYQFDRRQKKRVYNARVERGYFDKKNTDKVV